MVTGEMPDERNVASGKEKKEESAGELSDEWLGIRMQAINNVLAKKYKLFAGEKGIVVVEIDESKEAFQAGIREGDLIKSINQSETPDIKAFNKITKSMDISGGIVFDILREGKPLYISFLLEK